LAVLAVLAVRQLRSEMVVDLAVLNTEIGHEMAALDPVGAKRAAFRAAIAAASPFDLATRQLRRVRRKIA
jgi:hypothetical protein